MYTIQARDMSDEQWMSFTHLSNFLKKEMYPKKWKGKDSDWKELKNDILSGLQISGNSFSNSCYLFLEKHAVAYIDTFERRGNLYFEFDYFDKTIDENILEIISEEIYNVMCERNKDEAFLFTFSERIYEPILQSGAEIYDEMVNSKLLKEDIDFSNLEKIVRSNKDAESYELSLFQEIPGEIYDRFVNYMNEAIIDANVYHPKKKVIKEYTMKDLLERVEDIKNDDCPYFMFMIFDKNNIVAHCSVFIDFDEMHNKHWIDHIGAGFTSVGRNYRGKNLAKYLKAKMYLEIQKDYPDFEYALTDTYPWNKYMYRINEELGFKPYQKGYTFRFTKELLENKNI